MATIPMDRFLGGGMTDDFAAFELAGWQEVPAAYDAGFSRLTTQAVEPLLDAAGVTAGTRLLDLATGPGYSVATALRRGAEPTGVDFSAAMVEHARGRVPGADFRVGDAEDLTFEDGSFDAVVMGFGLLHLARPERALSESARVLVPGGRVALTVWAPPEEAVGFGIVLRAVAAHGEPNVPLPEGPPFFRFSDPAESVRALLDAGFEGPRIERVPQTWRLEGEDELFEAILKGTVRTGALLRAQEPAALHEIRREVAAEVRTHRRGAGIELPMPAVLASATKPK